MSTLHLSLCSDCGTVDIEVAQDMLRAAGMPETVAIKPSRCLGPCDRPVVMSLQSPGQAGYVFAGIDLIEDANDVVATCALYCDSDDGWIEDARPCGRLRHLLVARMPA
ncbi:MAG: DUF1636 family protein [Silicimonas sp.]|nr:DUF1636 family protein [Silicimonas sp.]